MTQKSARLIIALIRIKIALIKVAETTVIIGKLRNILAQLHMTAPWTTPAAPTQNNKPVQSPAAAQTSTSAITTPFPLAPSYAAASVSPDAYSWW